MITRGVGRNVSQMNATDLGLVTDFDPVARIEADGMALADAAERDLAARVEHCPDWSVADLVWHVREVHYFWGAIVRESLDDPQRVVPVSRPDDERQLLADYRDGVRELARNLAAADPFAPVWTWGQRHDAGFVVRHQVQEAAVHRWDAENATGRPQELDPTAAADSVDEFLTHSLPGRADDAPPLGGALVLASTDTAHAWRVVEAAGGDATAVRLDDVPATGPDGVTTVSGTASNLLLYLYRRVPASALVVDGDASVAERFPLRTGTD